jgi:hypothetical protein
VIVVKNQWMKVGFGFPQGVEKKGGLMDDLDFLAKGEFSLLILINQCL